MCELAKVTKDDVVMDPGCGDCIMLITAMEDFKVKRAIGTDYDPEMVKKGKDAVKAAKLEDKISVKEGNALKLGAEDLKDVTVVMLYMGNELNIRLRPALWEHLKPGARVVSHRFIMGDWKPDKSSTVNREGDYGVEDFHLHVWTITGKEKTGDYPKVDPKTLDQ
jgi:precorrin-6B methylase 2